MKIFTTNSLFVLLLSALIAPVAVAQLPQEDADNRIEKYENLTESQTEDMNSETEMNGMESQKDPEDADYRAEEKLREYQQQDGNYNSNSMYDVRRTEAFNLVSSGYRGQYEDQGIDGYAVFLSNYNSGQLTAEDLIQAAIQAGELSPRALEDESYVNAVESQLDTLKDN